MARLIIYGSDNQPTGDEGKETIAVTRFYRNRFWKYAVNKSVATKRELIKLSFYFKNYVLEQRLTTGERAKLKIIKTQCILLQMVSFLLLI